MGVTPQEHLHCSIDNFSGSASEQRLLVRTRYVTMPHMPCMQPGDG